jgi:virulence-associated protein VagC
MNCGDMGYFTPMLSDPLAASFITTVCFQWAGKNAIDQVNTLYPKVKKYQTEQECGQGETGAALWGYAVTSVYYNMKYFFDRMTSAYMQWNMVLAQGGFSSWGWPQNAMITVDTTAHTVTYNPQYYVVKHFSYYVKPNAKKVTVAGSYSDQVSFQNPDGSIVVVLENESASISPVSVTFGTNMINVSLPPNSFSTAVIYDSVANGVIHENSGFVQRLGTVKVTRSGNNIILTPPNKSSYEIQVLGIDGVVKASFSSEKGGPCVIKANEMPSGTYVLKCLIDGKRYVSTLPIVKS